jgi:hypothetical protein
MNEDDPWLNVPQAVVLSATGNLDLALGLVADDPALLLLKANWQVARLTVIEVEAEAASERRAEAYRRLQDEKKSGEEGRYGELQGQLQRWLIAGVRTKASRTPGGAYENIDPVEYTKVELQGVDAVDKRTGKIILFDLRVNCRDLIDRLAETVLTPADAGSRSSARHCQPVSEEIEKWRSGGDPVPKLIEWARAKWGEAEALPGRDEILRAFREQFGRVLGVNEKVMRDVRRQLAPPEARRGGAPRHRRSRSAGK